VLESPKDADNLGVTTSGGRTVHAIEVLVRRTIAHPFLSRGEDNLSVGRTIEWWEARRIPYNVIVGAMGILSCLLVVACEIVIERVQHVPAGPMPDPPLFAVVAVVAYGVGANVCYTMGWVVELLVRRLW